MKEWFIRLVLVGVLVVVGFWAWHIFFPNPEKIIRKRLGELAKAASFSSNEGLMAKAWNASVLGEFFTPDVQVNIQVPGSSHTIEGRDELMRAAVAARSMVNSLTIKFPDIKVTVAPDGTSAIINLTAEGKVPGQKDFYLQELRMRMIKVKRDWLINQVETVRTLSMNLGNIQHPTSNIQHPMRTAQLEVIGCSVHAQKRKGAFHEPRLGRRRPPLLPLPFRRGEGWGEGSVLSLGFMVPMHSTFAVEAFHEPKPEFPLTPTPLPKEREPRAAALERSERFRLADRLTGVLPLLGQRQGEGELVPLMRADRRAQPRYRCRLRGTSFLRSGLVPASLKSTCFLNVSTFATCTSTLSPSLKTRRVRRPISWLRVASNW